MGIDRPTLKRQARQAMKQTSPAFWVVALVYLVLNTWVLNLIGMFFLDQDSGDSINVMLLFIQILTMLVSVVLTFGFKLWALWTSRELNPDLGALFEGFSITGRVIWMEISILVRAMLWAMLFVLAILFAYTMLFALLDVYAAYLTAWLLLIAVCVVMWLLLLRYELAPFLLADRPDDGAEAAILRSVNLMRGWLPALAKLELSFFGWYLLSFMMTWGVEGVFLWQEGFFELLRQGELLSAYAMYQEVSNLPLVITLSNMIVTPLAMWLQPYHAVTLAGFYDTRLEDQKKSAPPLPPL